MKIGFTGTREEVTHPAKMELHRRPSQLPRTTHEFHHGGCIGADLEFHLQVRIVFAGTGAKIALHPPENPALRARVAGDITSDERPYLVRNKTIVDCTEALIAMPNGLEEIRSGTWSTIRYARKLGRPILIIWPDGHVTKENYRGS